MAVMERGSLRYQKNWLRKERRTQERVPRNHIRKVRTGREGSSVVGTVRATCGIGEFSSSDSAISGTGGGDFDEDEASSSSSPTIPTRPTPVSKTESVCERERER